MSFCEACQWIRDYAPGIAMGNGISEEQCNHLTENEGLIGENDNCADLQTLMDCLIGNAAEELRGVPLCDIKDWLGDMLANFHTIGTALVCNECGQWRRMDEIEDILRDTATGRDVQLVEGRDYNITYLNGYTPNGEGLNRGVAVFAQTNPFVTHIRIRADRNNARRSLRHEDPESIIRGRTREIMPDRPDAWMFSITFLNEWARLNTTDNASWTEFPLHWDITPSSANASHLVRSLPYEYALGMPGRIIMAPARLIDGYIPNTNYLFRHYTNLNTVTTARFSSDYVWMH